MKMHTALSKENNNTPLLKDLKSPGMIHYSGSDKAAHQAPA